MTVTTLTRPEVGKERRDLVVALQRRYGTTDRDELMLIARSGDLTFDEIAQIERLETLDYLSAE